MYISLYRFESGQNAPFADYFQMQMKFWISNFVKLWNCPWINVTEDKSTSVKINQWLDTIKQQAISWANSDQDLWHHMASLVNNELIVTKIIAPICWL